MQHPATVKIQSAHRGPHLVNEGLAFGMDADDRSRFYKGEPTVNLLYEPLGIFNLNIVGMTLLHTIQNKRFKFTYNNTSTKRLMIPLSRLQNGKTYTMSYKYKIIRGTFYMSDWCETSLFNRIDTGEYCSASGTRATYDNIYRYMDFYASADCIVEIWDFQLEQNDHATQFTTSARNSEESIFDLSKSVTYIDVGNTKFDSSAHPIYINPSATYVSGFKDTGVPAPTSITIESVFMPDPLGSSYRCALHKGDSSIGDSEFWLGINSNSNKITATIGAWISGIGYNNGMTEISAVANKYYHVLATWNGSNVYVYVNGNLEKTYALSTYNISQYSRIAIGSSFVEGGVYQFLGKIPIARVYWDKSFTEQEVKQNFNAYKTRFQIV